jgi:hypothetical protein
MTNPGEPVGSSGIAVTHEQLVAWRVEHARAVEERAELDDYIKILAAKIENASKSFVATPRSPSVRDRPRRRVRGKRAEAANPAEAPRMKPGSWTETVYQVVAGADRLLTMDELRDALGKARKLENAWISGVQRLKDSGHIVSYKWRIGTPAARRKFLEDVARGRAQDFQAVRHRSRWGAAICALLKDSDRDLTAHEISLELRKDPVFANKLSRNPYQVYQSLRALIATDRVKKIGKAYRFAKQLRGGIAPHASPRTEYRGN